MTYRGATLNWYGRQLKTFIKNGTTTSMTYDADGLRSTKTVGTRKFEYQYVGDKLYYEKRGDNQEFYYFYDSYGKLAAIYYTLVDSTGTSSAVYYVQTNSFGDVLRLYNSSAQVVANYEYDAWGNTLSVTDANGNPITTWYHIANSNPIRYRGYYYDSDLGLYYLQSRYYDSEIGRFINADGYITTGQGVMSYNMYSYCMNNPVNATDPSGYSCTVLFVLGCLVIDALITGIIVNHAINLNNRLKIENEVNDSYTQEQTKEIIEETTGKDTVNFNDKDANVSIKDSYKITSRYDRQKFCTIISRTEGCTQREYDNFSAEWYGHNLMYYARLKLGSVIPWDLDQTGKVNLDYIRDKRNEFVVFTKILEVLGMD